MPISPNEIAPSEVPTIRSIAVEPLKEELPMKATFLAPLIESSRFTPTNISSLADTSVADNSFMRAVGR